MKVTGVLSYCKTVLRKTMPLVEKEKEITIDAPWGKISMLTWGNAKNPPVLLCHGRQDVSSSYRPLVSRLPEQFYYVSVDLPGHGKSDSLAQGVTISFFDLVPTIKEVMDHFRWNEFIYIGHSLGVLIGKYFMMAYPRRVTKFVQLDPVPAYFTYDVDQIGDWYHLFYGDYYKAGKYERYNGPVENAPKYTYEKAMEMMLKTRRLTPEAAEHVLERSLEPAGDGLYRFNYDPRMKIANWLPFSSEYMQKVYTSIDTPTLCVLADQSISPGLYDKVSFVKKPDLYKGYYRVVEVSGNHDAHINEPESMSEEISEFLVADFEGKSKL